MLTQFKFKLCIPFYKFSKSVIFKLHQKIKNKNPPPPKKNCILTTNVKHHKEIKVPLSSIPTPIRILKICRIHVGNHIFGFVKIFWKVFPPFSKKKNKPNKQTKWLSKPESLTVVQLIYMYMYFAIYIYLIFRRNLHIYLVKRPFFINVLVHASTSFSRTFAAR